MSFLPYILLGVYALAINLYELFLIKAVTDNFSDEEQKVSFANTKILLAGLFGGALLAYLSLFFFKYTSNILLMVLLPLMIVANVYLGIWLVRGSIILFAR